MKIILKKIMIAIMVICLSQSLFAHYQEEQNTATPLWVTGGLLTLAGAITIAYVPDAEGIVGISWIASIAALTVSGSFLDDIGYYSYIPATEAWSNAVANAKIFKNHPALLTPDHPVSNEAIKLDVTPHEYVEIVLRVENYFNTTSSSERLDALTPEAYEAFISEIYPKANPVFKKEIISMADLAASAS